MNKPQPTDPESLEQPALEQTLKRIAEVTKDPVTVAEFLRQHREQRKKRGKEIVM